MCTHAFLLAYWLSIELLLQMSQMWLTADGCFCQLSPEFVASWHQAFEQEFIARTTPEVAQSWLRMARFACLCTQLQPHYCDCLVLPS